MNHKEEVKITRLAVAKAISIINEPADKEGKIINSILYKFISALIHQIKSRGTNLFDFEIQVLRSILDNEQDTLDTLSENDKTLYKQIITELKTNSCFAIEIPTEKLNDTAESLVEKVRVLAIRLEKYFEKHQVTCTNKDLTDLVWCCFKGRSYHSTNTIEKITRLIIEDIILDLDSKDLIRTKKSSNASNPNGIFAHKEESDSDSDSVMSSGSYPDLDFVQF